MLNKNQITQVMIIIKIALSGVLGFLGFKNLNKILLNIP